MGQPKKLSFAQKQERKREKEILDAVDSYMNELNRINAAMISSPSGMDTWKWAALEIYRELSKLPKYDAVQEAIEEALDTAREAQTAINFLA